MCQALLSLSHHFQINPSSGRGKAHFTDVKARFISVGSQKKQENSRKTSTSASLTTLKPSTVWITTNCGKFLKGWEHQTTLPASWETCTQVKKQQLDPNMEKQTGSKSGKECIKAVYYHRLFNLHAEYIMWNAKLDESQAGIKIARRNINNLRYANDTTLMVESEEELKSLLMKVKEESERAGLKFNIQKAKVMASGPITSWHIDGETMETVAGLIFLAPNHCIWWLQPWK